MLDVNCLVRVRDSRLGALIVNQLLGDHAATWLGGRSNQLRLHDVANGFRRVARGPARRRRSEAPPLPPIGILAGQMTYDLERSGVSFPRVVMDHSARFVAVRILHREV